MKFDCFEFLNDIQSIIPESQSGFVLFCDNKNRAMAIQQQLQNDFKIYSVTGCDKDGIHYVVPFETPDDKIITDFIRRGLDWDKDQKFIQYTVTLYNADTATKMYNILNVGGYDVTMLPNNMQLIIKCLDNSSHNDEIRKLKCDLADFEKLSTVSMDDYFNKVLFSGKIEKNEYRKKSKQEFSIDEIEQNKDIIVRGILYQYFNKRIRAYLGRITFPKKFDANKLDNKVKQNINLIRDFLYSVTKDYVNAQIKTALQTKHWPIIRFDYLKSCNEYCNFKQVLKQAKQWQDYEKSRNKAMKSNLRMSEKGTLKIMNLNNGYSVVQLFTPESLDYEGSMLQHCAGDGYYDKRVHEPCVEIYSVRDAQGKPHLTIEVNDGKIIQCYGYKNTIPCDQDLRTTVRALMREQRLDIPDVNGWNRLIAYVKQDGKLYDVFNLPQNFVFKSSIDLCAMKLTELPDMHTVTIEHSFSCATNLLSDLTGAPCAVYGDVKFGNNPLVSLRGMPRYVWGHIFLHNTRLTAKSFVPIYMENKLNYIVGIDEEIIKAWKQQIVTRKKSIANIIASLSNAREK